MRPKSESILSLLCCLLAAPLLHPQARSAPQQSKVCNQDRTLCVNAAVEQSVIGNPLYFEVEVRCADRVELGWELRDDSGWTLAQDPDGSLAFVITRKSASDRTLAVRDFGLAPATTSPGKLVLHVTPFSSSGRQQPLPDLSVPVRLDLRTTTVTYAAPADPDAFSRSIAATMDTDPAHPVPMQAEVRWLTKTLLYTPPAMLEGAATEAAALSDSGQGPWHVVNYQREQSTAHITILGEGWAGVSYYLAGLDYLLEKTTLHQPGVRHVVFDQSPDPGQ
jgi:hypothetical protein